MKTKNMTILHLRKSVDGSPLRRGFRFGGLALVLACCALPPASRALLPPPAPDGGYPNGNTAEGDNALFSLTTGTFNTATGADALEFNTNGGSNTTTGVDALELDTTGGGNTANGVDALECNTTGGGNTATGSAALFSNNGQDNTATGRAALSGSKTGFKNTANGNAALSFNETGNGNTAEGAGALGSNTGSFNAAVGFNAGASLTTGSNNIDIGAAGVAGESNTMRIGTGRQTATFIAGIRGATVASGVGVIVGSNSQLGTVVSSARFKEAIKPMDKASDAILALKPVTFHYKKDLDPKGIPQFGLVAEEVEKVNPDLVARDEQGKPYTVRYEAVNAMLLNEFLKEHRKNEEQGAAIAQQQMETTALKAELKEQASQIQKVNDKVELTKPASQTVLNNH
jgi:Chaperone of endosialidase